MSPRFSTQPNLRSVGGRFKHESPDAKKVSVPFLETVGGRFQAQAAEVIVAPRLKRVGGSVDTSNAREFYRPNLEFSGEWKTHWEAMILWERRQKVKRALRDQPTFEL